MIKKRLLAIAEMIQKEDSVVDIGCDHGYLSIYLKEQKKITNIIASDINENALENALKNIKLAKLEKKIKVIKSNGLEKIPLDSIDTIVIAGMGTNTILSILADEKKLKNIKKIILQSNNDYPLLRLEMMKKNYSLIEETLIFEKNHYYFIMNYQKGLKKLTNLEIKYGLWKKENIPYYEYLLETQKNIIKNIPFLKFKLKKEKKQEKKELSKYLKQKTRDC